MGALAAPHSGLVSVVFPAGLCAQPSQKGRPHDHCGWGQDLSPRAQGGRLHLLRVGQRIGDHLGLFLPWPRVERTCFFGLRAGPGGPATFAAKLARRFERETVRVTYRRLRSAQSALLFSVSRGDWFHRLCSRWRISTVLRVDGFFVPSYFDNRPQPSGFQERALTLTAMDTNHRMQRDLLLSNFVVYQSAFCKQMADQFLYNRRERFSIIFNGVDLDHFSPGPPRQGRRRLLSAGTLRDEYVLGTVLPVFGRLWRDHDLELSIVGPMDEINRRLLDDFRREQPEAGDRIYATGPVPNADMPHHMRQADLLLHPRLGDWCPNTVVEAMACGLPVVCGSWGGTAELVGNAGEIVPTGAWEYGAPYIDGLVDVAEAVLDSLDHYRAAARARAMYRFNIQDTAQEYLCALKMK